MANESATITVMKMAARKASIRLKRDYGEVGHLLISKKGPGDFVTAADVRTEKILREELVKARPDFGFLMEESGEIKGNDCNRRWIVDPIDGTTNFIHGLAHFSICIALEEYGHVTAGLIFDPINEELFWAEKGTGAYLNDQRVRVSSQQNLKNSIFATGIPFGNNLSKIEQNDFLQKMQGVMSASAGIRRFGSASLDLAYVAAGRFEGYWENNLNLWDIAAGILIVREAGGIVTDLYGKDYMATNGSIIAANPSLHKPLLDLVKLKV